MGAFALLRRFAKRRDACQLKSLSGKPLRRLLSRRCRGLGASLPAGRSFAAVADHGCKFVAFSVPDLMVYFGPRVDKETLP
jgi:hypothetical protein